MTELLPSYQYFWAFRHRSLTDTSVVRMGIPIHNGHSRMASMSTPSFACDRPGGLPRIRHDADYAPKSRFGARMSFILQISHIEESCSRQGEDTHTAGSQGLGD